MARILISFIFSLAEMDAVFKTGPFFILPHFDKYMKRKVKPEDKIVLAPPDHFSPLLDPIRFGLFNRRCREKQHAQVCKEWFSQNRQQNVTLEIMKRKPFLMHRFTHLGVIRNKKFKSTYDVCRTDLKISRFRG